MPALIRRSSNLGRFGSMLVVLVVLMVVSSVTRHKGEGLELLSLIFSALLAAGVYSVSGRPAFVYCAIGLALPALTFEWFSNYYTTTWTVVVNLTLMGLFVAFVASVILYEILDEEGVSLDTIFGGIVVYLLLGVGWAFGYAIIMHLNPGSFPLEGQGLQTLRESFEFLPQELIYFSFVTMTTLGYGDMSPTNPIARTFAILQAVTGQLYVAIFIARLVALHITQRRPRD